MKKYDEIKVLGFTFVIIAWLGFGLAVANCFINSLYIRTIIWTINAVLILIAFVRIFTILHNEKVEKRALLKRLGFREDFDYDKKFNLKTRVGKYEVSTVDLGINYRFDKSLSPLYYETIIFKKEKNKTYFSEEFDYLVRYSTKKEAKKGHKEAIKLVKEKLKHEKSNS